MKILIASEIRINLDDISYYKQTSFLTREKKKVFYCEIHLKNGNVKIDIDDFLVDDIDHSIECLMKSDSVFGLLIKKE